MKIARYWVDGKSTPQTGIVEGSEIREISGDVFGEWKRTGNMHAVDEVKLLAPVVPRHVIGIGANFVEPGSELPEPPELPIFFFKPVTAVAGPEDTIVIPGKQVKYESELAVIIGKSVRNIKEDEAMEAVFGYTVANDLADPEYFHPAGHWTVGKAFDTFCPLGPVIETELDMHKVRIQARLNGITTQDSGLEWMITSIPRQIALISSFMTLQPGDVLLTGTPAGAGMMQAGDRIECIVEGIGVLANEASVSNN